MNTSQFIKASKVIALAALFCTCGLADASDKKVAEAGVAMIPQSVFVDKQDSGRDPFFPQSVRRRQVITRVVATNQIPQVSAILGQLSLKGISGTKAQPLALINSSTIAEGELADIRCGRQIVKVRCVEIRDRSVLVELHGTSETRELKLRDGI
jgi:hypothetical protein